MPRSQQIRPEIQWAVVRLTEYLDHEQIATSLDISVRSVKRIISHFNAHGTVPNPGEDTAPREEDGHEPIGLPTYTAEPHARSSDVQCLVPQMSYPMVFGGYGYLPPLVIQVVPPCQVGQGYQVSIGYEMPYPPAQPMDFQHHAPFHFTSASYNAPPLNIEIPASAVLIPDIVSWFSFLDQHEQRNKDGITFAPFGPMLKAKGLHRVSQLAPRSIEPSDLQDWLGIKFGVAILIMQYAEEDLEAAKSGRLNLARNIL